MKRVYLAGPMTGYPEWNFPAFERATADLRTAGYDVVSPHEIDLEDGFDPQGDGSGFDLREALERDVEEVLNADGVALLDGWEESPGAMIEVLTASSTGAPAYPVRDWLAGLVALAVAVASLAGGVFVGNPDEHVIDPASNIVVEAGSAVVEGVAEFLEDITEEEEILGSPGRVRGPVLV